MADEKRNPMTSFVGGIVLCALALNIAWNLLQPVLPAIAAVVLGVVVWRAIEWHRSRW